MRLIFKRTCFLIFLLGFSFIVGCSTPAPKKPDYEKIKDNADKSIKNLEKEQKH